MALAVWLKRFDERLDERGVMEGLSVCILGSAGRWGAEQRGESEVFAETRVRQAEQRAAIRNTSFV